MGRNKFLPRRTMKHLNFKENNMSVKTTGMKPEEMKRNLWVIYRSLPNGMNEEEYNTILTLV